MVIVENKKEFKEFAESFSQFDSIVIPIECDFNKHPKDTKLCLMYVRILFDMRKEYILPFRHSDALNLDIQRIEDLWTPRKVYTYDKKKLQHFFNWNNTHDVQMNYYLEKNEPLVIDDITTNSHEYFHRKYYDKPNVNCVIPVMKHLEWCRKLVDNMKYPAISGTKSNEKVYNIYNDEVLENLQKMIIIVVK